MTLALPATAAGGTDRAEPLRRAVLWLMLVGGAFVFAEPSPYEIGALVAILTFMATGGCGFGPFTAPSSSFSSSIASG